MVFSHTLHIVTGAHQRNGLNTPSAWLCLWLQIENIINENTFIVKTISPWLYKSCKQLFFFTFFRPRNVRFFLARAPLKAHFANVALTQSQMANLIDCGLIHSSLALLLPLSHSTSLSLSHSVCMFLCQSGGIAVHVAITLLRLFFHLMTEHVFSPVHFGEFVRACKHERMSSDLSLNQS